MNNINGQRLKKKKKFSNLEINFEFHINSLNSLLKRTIKFEKNKCIFGTIILFYVFLIVKLIAISLVI